MPFSLEPREYINFTVSFDAALARLRKHLAWTDSPEGQLQALKHRLADAQRDLPRAEAEQQARIQEDIAELERQIAEQQAIIANPQAAEQRVGKRSGAWLKYRINRGQELVIGGYVPGNPIDSIIVGYYQDGTLLYAGKVRNGFVPHTRRAVAAKLRGLEIATCPFANLPERKRTQWALTKEEMKNCKWVRPEVVAQIEFTEWTPDAHLRQSAFVGLREDKDPRQVVREAER